MLCNAWHVYILQCADETFYTGIARDLRRRLRQHNGEQAGGPKYTRGPPPVQLVWWEAVADRSAASQREASIKKLSRADKCRLIAGAGE